MMRQLSITVLVVLAGAVATRADYKSEVGFTSLQARLGPDMPTGAGVDASHVEAPETGGAYRPDPDDPDFINPNKTFVYKTGGSANPSDHATLVGRFYYGKYASLSPDIMTIDVYEAGHWLGSGAMRWWGQLAPAPELRRVQNHSWVSTSVSDAEARDLLRRVDLLVQRDGVVIAAGVNNGSTTPMPKLVCSAYNILAVGRTDGGSSRGPTLVDEPGRVKPDIVAPLWFTSYTTPLVGSATALLLETMDVNQSVAYLEIGRRRPAEAMLAKTLLMAGATKDEFASWRKGFATPCTDGTVPLDYRYGAGELNIDNSHRILTAGEHESSDDSYVPLTGWDYDWIQPGQPRPFFFEIPPGDPATRVSILVTWHRRIAFLVSADFDADGDVDEADGVLFESCATAPGVGPVTSPCQPADFDGDGDVDQSDFGLFQVCISGYALPPPAECPSISSPATMNASLANIDLHLRQADGFTPGALLDQSISAIDNVEHIYLENVESGRYVFELTSDVDWDYAIAWDVQLASAAGAGTGASDKADRDDATPPAAVPIPDIQLNPAP